MAQPSLPFPAGAPAGAKRATSKDTAERDARAWAAQLSHELGYPVELTFGRARRNVIVARRHGERLELRLSEGFREAPPDVREALSAWLKNGKRARRACARLDSWIAELAGRLGPPEPRRVRIRAQGEHHDLEQLARELLRDVFAGELEGALAERVTWGRRATRPARRTMQLGSFEATRNVVRIHPVLDQAAVPTFFVRYVLFHELLHAALASEQPPRGSRAAHHSPEFRRRERAYADYGRALAWQERHLPALFRSARNGRPMRAK